MKRFHAKPLEPNDPPALNLTQSPANRGFAPSLERRGLSLAISAALALGLQSALPAQAQIFPASIELFSIEDGRGFVVDGQAERDQFGRSVSAAGDVNGDGIDDLVIGAPFADANGNNRAGRSYVVFGTETGIPLLINGGGFVLFGESANDRSGVSVSAAGDINGDGLADIIIGAPDATANNNLGAGRSYVIFGSDEAYPSPFNLSALNGDNGFWLNGEAAFDNAGSSVSAASDINGDGVDDLIIGAPGASVSGIAIAGRTYVVFGSSSGLPHPFDLSSLNGSNGFAIYGEPADYLSGSSVSTAGDINGDGIDDLIIGAPLADSNGTYAGRSYVVFGSAEGFPNPFNLTGLDADSGFVIDGEATYDRSGFSVSAAGDINGDGIDDLIIGAPDASSNGIDAGRGYVVFGSSTGLPHLFNLSSLNGINGFALNCEGAYDSCGYSVSAAGDINGDGIDDLIIGAPDANPGATLNGGRSYVVFGSSSGLPHPFDLSSLNGDNGFVLDGVANFDNAGASVSAAGDVNGDGLDDLIVGVIGASGSKYDSGRSFVIFGRGDRMFNDRFDGD